MFEIQEILKTAKIAPEKIPVFAALQGPGPFTAVRTIAVIGNTWKSEFPDIKLLVIPTGAFLRRKFPEAEHILLSAGRNAFFSFSRGNPENFTKVSIEEGKSLKGKSGGYVFDQERRFPNLMFQESIADPDAFREILQEKEKYEKMVFIPEYGAEPAISMSRSPD